MDSSPSLLLDDSLRPVLRVTFPRWVSDAQHKTYLAWALAQLRRGEKVITILDTRLLESTTAEQRQRQADFAQHHDALLRAHSLGTVVIVTSPAMALMARLILHLRPLSVPYSIVSSWPAAVAWVTARLTQSGLSETAEWVGPRLEQAD